MSADALRAGRVAGAIRAHRLVVVLRRIEPREALLDLVVELVRAGARVLEVTMDAPSAADDLRAIRERVDQDGTVLGAGTVVNRRQLDEARAAGADFAVSPVLDPSLVTAAIAGGLPFVAGGFTPTEISAAWRAGATFVKLFPASAAGASFVRELRGPMPEVEIIPTGGIDAANAREFLAAGAAAVGIGGALVRADGVARRDLIASIGRSQP
jgi:2-dehydro-3-deoxyphosphogluconate aldolase / (4S)-4-hydroxy-2-oxoglutarate aldolase